MKIIALASACFLAAFSALSAPPATLPEFRDAVRAYLASAGHPDPLSVDIGPAGAVAPVVSSNGYRILTWSVSGYDAPAGGLIEAVTDAEYQESKPVRLKAAEKKLIQFLRDEGAVAADATSATAEQIDAMYANWEATLNDTQLEKKSTKYTRLIERVERAGGSELGSRFHP